MDHRGFLTNKVIKGKPCFMQGWWTDFYTENQNRYPWKMHIYSDSEEDWQKLTSTLEPYFTDNNIHWKTLSHFETVEDLNKDTRQKGKAITIYPHSQDEFFQLAYELNYIIKKNKLQREDTSIKGDRALGNSGRIFYRYELQTGKYKDTVFDKSQKEQNALYKALYKKSTANGNYLADDMTVNDDPFYYYNPDTNAYDYSSYPQMYTQQYQGYQGYPDYQQF